MHFAVFGDLHHCTMSERVPAEILRQSMSRIPDYPRYAAMAETVRHPLFAMAKAEKPELVISTGDLIEGGADSARDMFEANALLAEISNNVYRSPGSHDIFPPRRKEFCSFRRNGNLFLILDYTDWNAEQRDWLIQELENSVDAKHIFVFGHAPLYLFARHFFHSAGYADDVAEILVRYPVDIYFCGHTHNQTVSRHGKMLQIVGSSVGHAHAPAIPLEQFHTLPPTDSQTHFYWGFPEDYQPGFWLVETEGEALHLKWRSLNNSGEIHIPARFAEPEIRPPRFEPYSSSPDTYDFLQIQSAWLNIFSANKGINDSEILFNGVSLGEIPKNPCYAGRRFVTLPQEALATIRTENQVKIRFPNSPAFAIGSLSLDLLLLDGRRIRSQVASELFLSGDSPDFRYAAKRCEQVIAGSERDVAIDFSNTIVKI